jgi:hypothetical protein
MPLQYKSTSRFNLLAYIVLFLSLLSRRLALFGSLGGHGAFFSGLFRSCVQIYSKLQYLSGF